MKRFAILVLGILFFGHGALAQSWATLGVSASPLDAPKVVAAIDAFMASDVGKQFNGRLLLQANLADGDNPATHSIVPIYSNAGDREAFTQKAQGSAPWAQLMGVFTEVTQPVSTTSYRVLKSWGDINDTDSVWMTHSFNVSDPQGFLAALEAFRASPTGQQFNGQVYLSAVVAGGLTPVTHVLSVGYPSEAAVEAWAEKRAPTKDWADYVKASTPTGEYLGSALVRDIKAWGPASLQQLTGQ